MAPLDIDELNRILERETAPFGFSATARIADDTVEFDATTWQQGGAVHYFVACPIDQVEADLTLAADEFIKSARASLLGGTSGR